MMQKYAKKNEIKRVSRKIEIVDCRGGEAQTEAGNCFAEKIRDWDYECSQCCLGVN